MQPTNSHEKARFQEIMEERHQRFRRSIRRLNNHTHVNPHGRHAPNGRPPSPLSTPTSAPSDPADRSNIMWAVFNNLVRQHLGVQPTSVANSSDQHALFDRYLASARAVVSKPSLNENVFVQSLSTGYDTAHLTDKRKLEKVSTDPLNMPLLSKGAVLVHEKLQRAKHEKRTAKKQFRAMKRSRTAQLTEEAGLDSSPREDSLQLLSPTDPQRLTRSSIRKLHLTSKTMSECCFCPDLAAYDGKELESELIGPFVDRRGNAKLYVHFDCACWAPQVYADPATGQLRRVYDEHRRGRQLKCSLCSERGATIGCYVQRCKKVFHLRCLRRSGAYTVERFFAAFCQSHSHLGKQKAYHTLMEAATIADVAASQRREDTTFGLDAPHSRYTLLRRRETEVIFSRRWRICSHIGPFESGKILFSHKRRKFVSKRDRFAIADRVRALRTSAIDVASGRLAYLAIVGEEASRSSSADFQVRAALASRDIPTLLLLRNLRHAPDWNKDDFTVVKKILPAAEARITNLTPLGAKPAPVPGTEGNAAPGQTSDGNQTSADAPESPSAEEGLRTPRRERKRSIQDLHASASGTAQASKRPVKRVKISAQENPAVEESVENVCLKTVPLPSTRIPALINLQKAKIKENDEGDRNICNDTNQGNAPLGSHEDGASANLSSSDAHTAEKKEKAKGLQSQEKIETPSRPVVTSNPRSNPRGKPKSAWEAFLERQLPKERMLRPDDAMEDSMRNMARLWSLMTTKERDEYETISLRTLELSGEEMNNSTDQPSSKKRSDSQSGRGKAKALSVDTVVVNAGLFVRSNVSEDHMNRKETESDQKGESGKSRRKTQSKGLPRFGREISMRIETQSSMDWDELFPTSLRGLIPEEHGDGPEVSRRVHRVRPPPGHGKSAK